MKHKWLVACLVAFGCQCIAGPSIVTTGVVINKGGAVYPGNVLFVDCNAPNTDASAKAYLVDQTGKILHTWSNQALLFMAKPYGTDGSIVTWRRKIISGSGCGDTSGAQMLFRISQTNVATKLYYNSSLLEQNHDYDILPNGDYIILGRKLITDSSISQKPLYDDRIVRVDHVTGQVVWYWSTAEHYAGLGLSARAKAMIMAGQTLYPPVADVFHTNSIQWIPPNASAAGNSAFSEGNILVSQRNTNLIYVIDYSTGKIVWKTNSVSIGQHHVKMIPNGLPGSGHILMFNNGGEAGYPAKFQLFSTVLEYDPIAFQVTWRYKTLSPDTYGLSSYWRGSAQRLPNGNTFIDEAEWGRFFEVDPQGNIVWEYLVPFANPQPPDRIIYRAYKVEACWPGCDAENALPDGRWTW